MVTRRKSVRRKKMTKRKNRVAGTLNRVAGTLNFLQERITGKNMNGKADANAMHSFVDRGGNDVVKSNCAIYDYLGDGKRERVFHGLTDYHKVIRLFELSRSEKKKGIYNSFLVALTTRAHRGKDSLTKIWKKYERTGNKSSYRAYKGHKNVVQKYEKIVDDMYKTLTKLNIHVEKSPRIVYHTKR